MKTIRIANSRIEAELLVGVLASHGIHAVIEGSREYAAIVTGSDYNQYNVSVAEEVEDEAIQVLAAQAPSMHTATKDDEPTPIGAQTYLKRAVVFGVLGLIMLPVIFNYASLMNLKDYRKTAEPTAARQAWTFVIGLLNLAGLVMIMFFVRSHFAK